MKYFFIVLIFLAWEKCFSQSDNINLPIDPVSGKCVFTEVVKVDSLDASALFSRAKLFLANTYNSSKNVTQLADDKSMTIVIKAYQPTILKSWAGVSTNYGGFNYSLKIFFKDGRYKYEISDLIHTCLYDIDNCEAGGAIENEKPICGTLSMTKKSWESLKAEGAHKMKELITELKIAMNMKTAQEKNDW